MMPEEINTPQITEPAETAEPEKEEEIKETEVAETEEQKEEVSENADALVDAELKDLAPNPIKNFLQKLTQKFEPIINQIREKWEIIDEDKRKKIIPIAGLVGVLFFGIFVWKSFFGGKKIENKTQTTEQTTQETKQNLTSHLSPLNSPPTTNHQPPTNNDNRVIPALHTTDLESWSGLKQDRYEMKKRGQLKTVPEKIIEKIPAVPISR